MIVILERTHSNVQQNIEQLQTPAMGVTINKKSTTTDQGVVKMSCVWSKKSKYDQEMMQS